jgi:hypothetical protein
VAGSCQYDNETSSSSSSFSFSLCLFQASDFLSFLLMDPLDIW